MGDEAAVGKLVNARRIAVVGLSPDPARDSYVVAAYLQLVGKEIIPVNPNVREVLGLKAYPSLADIPGKVDLVDVFRRAEFCPEVTRQAIAIGAPAVWLQLGIVSPESRKLASEAGLWYVEDRCILIEHRRSGLALDIPVQKHGILRHEDAD